MNSIEIARAIEERLQTLRDEVNHLTAARNTLTRPLQIKTPGISSRQFARLSHANSPNAMKKLA